MPASIRSRAICSAPRIFADTWKATRVISLNGSPEEFQLHLPLGEPQDGSLEGHALNAQNILRKAPGRCELVREKDAEAFAEALDRGIRQHPKAG